MYRIVVTRNFERSYKKLKRSGSFRQSARADLEEVIDLLASGKSLPSVYRDHQLQGELQAYRECHIKGDLLLIYTHHHEQFVLLLVDIGSHSYLFD